MNTGSNIEAFDVLLTSGHSVLNRMTKVLTKHRGEPATVATHQGMFVDPYTVVEAIDSGVTRSNWDQYKLEMLSNNTEWCIYRYMPSFSAQMHTLGLFYLEEMVGWKYSKLELILCAFDGILGKMFAKDTIFFRRFDLFRRRVICSKTANRVAVKLRALPQDAYYWTPDDTCDYMQQCPDWEIIDRSNNWPKER